MRLRCRFMIHCYHPHKYEYRIEPHGVFHEDKGITEMNYICCYCGYKTTEPARFGPMCFLGKVEWHRVHAKAK